MSYVSHVQLRVADLSRALGFYRDLLGLSLVADRGTTIDLAARGAASPMLTLREVAGLRPRPRRPRTAGLYHVAWLVPSRAALGRALVGLDRARYPLTGASDHLVSESLYLDDPDGNGVEIYADRPRETWQWHDGRVAMAVDPLDLHALASTGETGESSESGALLPAGTTIGHVHLVASDLPAARDYFTSVVGLDVTLEWPQLVGLSSGGYHHHVNLNNWAGADAPPDDGSVAGLDAVTMGGRTLSGSTSAPLGVWTRR